MRYASLLEARLRQIPVGAEIVEDKPDGDWVVYRLNGEEVGMRFIEITSGCEECASVWLAQKSYTLQYVAVAY